jgi:hypothetical protein
LFAEQLILFTLLVVALVVNVIAEASENNILRVYSKPFLIPLLIVYYLLMCTELNYFVVLALLFAFNGDLALLFQYKNFWFRAGAVLFMVAHLFFIAAMTATMYLPGISLTNWLWPIVPAIVFSLLLYLPLHRSMEKFRIISIPYIIIVAVLLYSCLLRSSCFGGITFWFPVIGTLLFLVSDFFIAYTRFKKDFKYAGVLIMVTYVVAEALWVLGMI